MHIKTRHICLEQVRQDIYHNITYNSIKQLQQFLSGIHHKENSKFYNICVDFAIRISEISLSTDNKDYSTDSIYFQVTKLLWCDADVKL